MFNLIEEELKKQDNLTRTENGAIGYKSTDSALVDLNYKVNSLRDSEEDEIIKLFDSAFHENPAYAVKWLFFARDIREGLGERRLFRICYSRLLDLDKDLFLKNLEIISEYGRWDDLVSLIGISNVTDECIGHIIDEQLTNDINNMMQKKSISLLGKWLPSENASSKDTISLAKQMRGLLGLSSKKYRLLLSELRRYLDVVEVKMCGNEWNSIDYNKVPSLANLKYKNAFMRHDETRRTQYLESVSKGESKINMKVATPVDVVSKYTNINGRPSDYDEVLELAWDNLKDVSISDTMVVADGSGSMTIPVGGSRTVTALDVANSLAIYTSEHNTGVFKDKYITFSNRPQFVDLSNDNSLKEKLENARKHCEVSNTNILAVFKLILGLAVKNDIPNEEMISNILIISDMEFDYAQKGWGNRDTVLSKSLFEEIREYYNEVGYDLPKLIFWNVNSRTGAIPLTENDMGVVLVSGFSQNVLKMVMSEKYNPYEVLIEMITSERYDLVQV